MLIISINDATFADIYLNIDEISRLQHNTRDKKEHR